MGTAYAQSNVTLYGLIDESLNYVSNEGGHSAFTQTSGNVQGSRWGIKGTEELGGLEFGRQAFVGLTTPAGTITLGRQYDFLIYLYSMTNLYSAGTYGVHLGDYDRFGRERLNNVIAYQSPTFGGLKFGALYAPGGQPGHMAAGSAQCAELWRLIQPRQPESRRRVHQREQYDHHPGHDDRRTRPVRHAAKRDDCPSTGCRPSRREAAIGSGPRCCMACIRSPT
jgi:predicted porin